MKLISRAEWGALPPRQRPGLSVVNATAHWEGPHMGTFDHSKCASIVRGIQRFHMFTRGWSDIAYNALGCPHGYVFEGRGPGVRSAANGTNEGNGGAYAMCFIGGVGDGFPTAGQVAMRDGMQWLAPNGGRNGHRDWKSTECPGDEIYRWVHSGAASGGSVQEEEEFLMAGELEKVAEWLGDTQKLILQGDLKILKAIWKSRREAGQDTGEIEGQISELETAIENHVGPSA